MDAVKRAASAWRDRRAAKTVNKEHIYATATPDFIAYAKTETPVDYKYAKSTKKRAIKKAESFPGSRREARYNKAAKRLGMQKPTFDPFA